jgi:hypothetical protein
MYFCLVYAVISPTKSSPCLKTNIVSIDKCLQFLQKLALLWEKCPTCQGQNYKLKSEENNGKGGGYPETVVIDKALQRYACPQLRAVFCQREEINE